MCMRGAHFRLGIMNVHVNQPHKFAPWEGGCRSHPETVAPGFADTRSMYKMMHAYPLSLKLMPFLVYCFVDRANTFCLRAIIHISVVALSLLCTFATSIEH